MAKVKEIKGASIVSVTILCPVLDREVTCDLDIEAQADIDRGYCECSDDHGNYCHCTGIIDHINVMVSECECGNSHEIAVTSYW